MQSGRVVSVNLAVVRTDPFTRVKSGRSGIDKRPADHPVRLEVGGVDGDTICDTKYHGGPEQAVYAYAIEDLDFWTTELDRTVTDPATTRPPRAPREAAAPRRIMPGNVGENLTLAGIDCSHAVVGERWQVGDAVLRVTGPRTPCRVFSGFLDVPDLIKRFFAAGRPGAYLAVEQPAAVSAGDPVTVLERPEHGVTVADLLAATAGHRELVPRIAQAREHLGPRGREWLDTVLAASRR
jgi:MOSC domain-containing protein YiiM